MMELTWDDQWIGYDDESTIARKKAWADDQCFGGTMAWSVDFNSGAGNGLTPNITTDGTCGVSNGHTVCGNWPAGNCCSAGGWCGYSAAHCGSGCQSGDCARGVETTDGTCGATNKDMVSLLCTESINFCKAEERVSRENFLNLVEMQVPSYYSNDMY